MTPPTSSIDTPRLRLVAGTALLHAAELEDATALGPLLGAEVPADWPPADGEYDRDAIGFFLRQLRIASSSPHEVAGCLERFMETSDDWNLIGGRGRIRSLLEALVPTSAADAAHTIAARLVARGRLDFRDLT